MSTGSAICPYCAGDREKVMAQEHVVSGPLLTKYDELVRHRDESQDPQVELQEGVVASRPLLREIELDGLQVQVPAGFRPAFVHLCPTSNQAVTLYADSEGGKVK